MPDAFGVVGSAGRIAAAARSPGRAFGTGGSRYCSAVEHRMVAASTGSATENAPHEPLGAGALAVSHAAGDNPPVRSTGGADQAETEHQRCDERNADECEQVWSVDGDHVLGVVVCVIGRSCSGNQDHDQKVPQDMS